MGGGAAAPNTWPHQDHPHLDPAASLSRLHHLVRSLDRLLRLPNTARSFFIYLGGLFLITAGAMLHILLAAQIMQDEVRLSRLNSEYDAIEQQNGDLIFRIARQSSMQRLYQDVLDAGYVAAENREYVLQPQSEAAAGPDAAATPAGDSAAAAQSRPATPQTGATQTGATHTGTPLHDWEALLGINLPFTSPSPGEAPSGETSPGHTQPGAAAGRIPGLQKPGGTGAGTQSTTSQAAVGQPTLDQTPLETWQNWLDESKAFFNRLVP